MRSSFPTPSIGKMLYGWSKFGGANYGIIREETDEWACQICGARQIMGLPQYFLPMDNYRRDFIRVCSGCWADIRKLNIKTYKELVRKVKDFNEKRKLKVRIIEYEISLKTSVLDKL